MSLFEATHACYGISLVYQLFCEKLKVLREGYLSQRCAIFNPIHIVNKPSTAWHNLDAWFIEDEIAK